ncbi:transglycosylase SLT domain-containing protein [Lentzea sp. NBRC 105346]|uniref:transglycosylase SLT domain-containing protein n=1 Tax=Lentzea sp. NBRC 105346 TaxID=3032205 RepID=UPI002556C435|nr:transglycosylase SLT domain-containing protein [Lentzea sp. NBRC 105346]
MKDDDKVPLAHRVSAVLVAAGVAAGTAAIAHVASAKTNPLAAGADLAVVPAAEEVGVKTVHAVNPGAEVARVLQGQQLYAMENFNAAAKVAKDGYDARQRAAAEEAARQAELRKPPKQREIEGWIKEAIKILQANGTNIDESAVPAIYTIIIKESNGNPNAVNNWDSNAMRGTPSKGLMQTIDPTFRAYALPGHGDIFNPVDNIIAGVRYTIARYGSFANHPGLASLALGGGYRGY